MDLSLSSVCSSICRLYAVHERITCGSRRYIFAGFCIDQDKEKLSRYNLNIANFIDIQKLWRVPQATKTLDSLGDVSTISIDDYYAYMKSKMTNQEHH